MKINCKRPLCIGGVDYPKGVHEIDDSMADNWFLLAAVQNNWAAIVADPEKRHHKKHEAPVHTDVEAKEVVHDETELAPKKGKKSSKKAKAKDPKKDE